MAITIEQADKACEYARAEGAERGRNAAEWYAQDTFGGRVTRGADAAARKVLQGIDDGDPEIWDTLPVPDLSGEWADLLNGSQLVSDAVEAAGIDEETEDVNSLFADVCDAYENAFHDSVVATIARYAKNTLGEID